MHLKAAKYAKPKVSGSTLPKPDKEPGALRKDAATLAGSLFSVLVEAGAKLDDPADADIRFDEPPPDPRITKIVAERNTAKGLGEVATSSRDLGLWNEAIDSALGTRLGNSLGTTELQNAGDVRHGIRGLRALVEVLDRRFPELPGH
jgi:hypothetical protein